MGLIQPVLVVLAYSPKNGGLTLSPGGEPHRGWPETIMLGASKYTFAEEGAGALPLTRIGYYKLDGDECLRFLKDCQ